MPEGVGWVEIRISVSMVKFRKFVPINWQPLVSGDIHQHFKPTLMLLRGLSTIVVSFEFLCVRIPFIMPIPMHEKFHHSMVHNFICGHLILQILYNELASVP